MGDFAKANRRTHEADKVKGVEEIKMPGPARLVYPGYQYQPDDGNGIS